MGGFQAFDIMVDLGPFGRGNTLCSMRAQRMQVPMRMAIASTIAAESLQPGYIRSCVYWVIQLIQPFS